MDFDEIKNLREAIKAAPDNVPLRKILANTLMKHERWEEAEIEIKEALRLAPNDAQLKVALATAFYELGKTSVGLVLLEELTGSGTPPANAISKSSDLK